MATRKRTKKQTLAEFRAWLSGVEELQPDDWAPTPEQWKLIRDKIDGIAEPKPPKPAPAVAQQATNNTPPPQHQQFQPPQGFVPPPPVPGGIPDGPVEVAPAAARMAPPVQSVDIASAAKPVDSGDGNYESGFI